MRRALLILFFAICGAAAAKAQNNYYVSTTGSDRNAGTSGSPWLTVQHAIDYFALGSGGAVIHVAPGVYTSVSNKAGCSNANAEWICVNRGGASTSVRLTIQCDSSNWPNWGSSGGCVANPGGNGSADTFGEVISASYITIRGFEYGNHPGAPLAMAIYAYADGFGSPGGGHDVTVLNNYFHDVGQSNRSGSGIVGCPAEGMITATYGSTGNVISGNKIIHFGDTALNNTNCNRTHGVYVGNGVSVTNNIIGQIVSWGIQIYEADCNVTVANNVVFDSKYGGIIIGNGSYPCAVGAAGHNTVINNIIVNNGSVGSDGAITLYGPQTNNYFANNIWYGNTPNACVNNAGGSCAATGNVMGNITSEAPSTTFVNFQDNGTGDYHIKTGSVAVDGGTQNGAGSPGCSGSCAPPVDFAGNPRPDVAGTNVDIGAYELGSSAQLPPTLAVISVN